MKDKKDETIVLRVSEAEVEAFWDAAESVGMSLSQWIRTLCRRASGLPTLGDENVTK